MQCHEQTTPTMTSTYIAERERVNTQLRENYNNSIYKNMRPRIFTVVCMYKIRVLYTHDSTEIILILNNAKKHRNEDITASGELTTYPNLLLFFQLVQTSTLTNQSKLYK